MMPADSSRKPASGGARNALRYALCGALGLFSLLINAPWHFVMPEAGVDPSWMLLLSRAAADHAQWGKDIVFTYGPYLDLVTRLLAPGHVAAAIIWRALMLAAALFPILFITRGRGAVWSWLTVAGAAVCFAYVQDVQFFLYPLLLSILHFRTQGRWRPLLLGGLAALGGLAILVKLSYGALYLPVLLAADADRLLRRKVPLYLAGFALSFVAFYLVAGQHFGSLAPYLYYSGGMIGGYGDAMARDANLPASLAQGLFVIFAVICLGIIARLVLLSRPGGQRLRAALFLATVLAFALISYKAGFSRTDLQHIPTALGCLGLALLLCLASAGDEEKNLPFHRAIAAVAMLMVFVTATLLSPNGRARGLLERPLQAALQAGAALAGPGRWLEQRNAEYRAALLAIRREVPLPRLEGSVDTIPSLQSAVIANGLDYRNRPVFQEYSDYTAALIGLNRAYFESARAPDFVIAAPESIDNRWPASAEGPLWPTLLSRYGVSGLSGDLVILRRRDRPVAELCEHSATVSALLGQAISPPAGDGTLFARIRVSKSAAGRLLSLLVRSEPLYLSATLDDGRTVVHRLVPGIAREGLILSPYVDSGAALAAVATGHAELLHGRGVRNFSIGNAFGGGTQYRADVEVSFCSLDPPPSTDPLLLQAIAARLAPDNASAP